MAFKKRGKKILEVVSKMKLGKAPKRHDPRTLKLSFYTMGLATAPPSCDHSKRLEHLGSMGNDDVGDCTCAAAGHLIQSWTAERGAQFIVPDELVLAMYSAVTGFNPADPNTDAGANVLDVLSYWRTVGLDNHKIGAFAILDPEKQQEIQKAIYYFGGCYLGVGLPNTAQAQIASGQPWDVVKLNGEGEKDSWGGHAIPAVAYDEQGVTVITWGKLQKVTWPFIRAYCEEAYACFSADLCDPASGKSPAGFLADQLQKDLKQITA